MKLALVLLSPLLTLLTCKAGSVGDAIAPDKPTAAAAIGEVECSSDQSRAEPLVVDWGSDDRTDLEVAMRDGIVVVSYDCNEFRVLEGCKVGGSYGFAGVGRKEDVVQIVGRDELHANFPLGAVKFEAGLERASAIDIALVTIGKHRSDSHTVAVASLDGECEGATHFVRSAVVGAFAVGTGTRGQAGTVAEVFKIGEVGGSSESDQKSLNSDGDLAACAVANPLDPQPPPQCQSLLRVELVALSADEPDPGAGPPAEEEALGNVCTVKGFVWDGKKCTKESEASGFRCAIDDAAECRTQCEQGNADSCHNLATMTTYGRAGLTADPAGGLALYEKACSLDSMPACSALVFRLDWKVEAARVTTLLHKTCEAGNAMDCRSLGIELIRGTRLPKDEVEGEKVLRGACSTNAFACSDLASFYYETQKSATRGKEVLDKACTDGQGMACAKLGGWLSRCEDGRSPGMSPSEVKSCEKFPDTNAKGATLAFEAACRAKFYGACRVAGDRAATGEGLTADAGKAFELYTLGCPFGMGSCEALGRAYEEGKGVTANLQLAYDTYAKGCDMASKGDCYEAARVAKKLGNDTDYRARLEKGCGKSSRRSCDDLVKLLEKENRKDDAKAIYADICTRMRDKNYCDSYLRLGGELAKDFKPVKRANRKPDDF